MFSSEHWIKRAREVTELALTMKDRRMREDMLSIADTYMDLAAQSDRLAVLRAKSTAARLLNKLGGGR